MAEGERCDLCNGEENVRWVWLTPSVATSVEEATEKHLFYAEDPEWAVCDTCHELIVNDKEDTLLARAYEANKNLIPLGFDPVMDQWVKVDIKDHIKRVHEAFWVNKTKFWEND